MTSRWISGVIGEWKALAYVVVVCYVQGDVFSGRRRAVFLEERMRAVLPLCAAKGIKIVTNMGAANPEVAAKKTIEIARS